MPTMPNHRAARAAIGLVGAIAVILLVMWIAGIGPFSTSKQATTTTTTVRIQAFNPANQSESRAYFVSLWASTKATEVEIRRQANVVKIDPSVSNQTALVGLKQNCMSIVAAYNAAALAIEPKAFRSAGLPPEISGQECSG